MAVIGVEELWRTIITVLFEKLYGLDGVDVVALN